MELGATQLMLIHDGNIVLAIFQTILNPVSVTKITRKIDSFQYISEITITIKCQFASRLVMGTSTLGCNIPTSAFVETYYPRCHLNGLANVQQDVLGKQLKVAELRGE